MVFSHPVSATLKHSTSSVPPVKDVLKRNLIFVSGKGGVGKTVVSKAIAQSLAKKGRTLWVTFEDPLMPMGELMPMGPTTKTKGLWHLNCEAGQAFEEYAAMKIGANKLTELFLKNKVVRYLAKAAPGIHELVLLGKVWFERKNYDYVVADMLSTGYGLAMFQSTENFSTLFRGGPIQKDAEDMLATFNDPRECGHLIVALPEEMPLVESLELNDFLLERFPKNAPAFLVNRAFPLVDVSENGKIEDPDTWTNPLPESAYDYAHKRGALETFNLRIWREKDIPFSRLEYVAPQPGSAPKHLLNELSTQLEEKGLIE